MPGLASVSQAPACAPHNTPMHLPALRAAGDRQAVMRATYINMKPKTGAVVVLAAGILFLGAAVFRTSVSFPR